MKLRRRIIAATALLLLCASAARADGLIAVDKVANTIRFLDPVTLQELSRLDPPEKSVHQLTLATDRTAAYVPLYGDGVYGANEHPNNKILIVDLRSRSLSGIIDLGRYLSPHGMVSMRDGRLWVACDHDNKLLLVDPAARSIEAVYDIPGRGSHFIAMLPDESKLYISNKESAAQVFDIRRRVFVAAIPAADPQLAAGNGSGFEGLAVSPDGRRVLIADNASSAIHVIDAATDRETGRVALQGLAMSNPKRSRLITLAFSPDGRRVVASAYASGQAWIIDAADLHRQRAVAIAKGPQGVVFDPDGRSVIVSSHDDGVLTRIDLRTGAAMALYDGGGGIETLAFF